jgi:hypothetical protein
MRVNAMLFTTEELDATRIALCERITKLDAAYDVSRYTPTTRGILAQEIAACTKVLDGINRLRGTDALGVR